MTRYVETRVEQGIEFHPVPAPGARDTDGRRQVAGLDSTPIASLTRRDLECMASNAISRFIVLASKRRTTAPDREERNALDLLLMG